VANPGREAGEIAGRVAGIAGWEIAGREAGERLFSLKNID